MKIKDEPLAEIREIRHQISQEFDNDPKKYTDYLQRQREKYSDQIKSYEDMHITINYIPSHPSMADT
jgi:hypothetical protein